MPTVAATIESAKVLHSAEKRSKKFPKMVRKMSVMLSFCIAVYLRFVGAKGKNKQAHPREVGRQRAALLSCG